MGEVFRNLVEVLRGSGLGFRIFFFFALIFGFMIFELYTGFGFHLRMTQQINLLAELDDLSDEPLAGNQELQATYDNLVQKLANYSRREQPSFNPITRWFTVERTWKFFSASLAWGLLGVAAMLGAFGLTTTNIGVGFVVLAVFLLFGYIGALVPTIYYVWISCVLNALVFQIAPLLLLSQRGRTQPSEGM